MLRTFINEGITLRSGDTAFDSGWIYHTQAWKNVLSDGFGVQSFELVTEIKSQIVAITPIYLRRRFGISLCGSPLRGTFTQYAGPRFLSNLSLSDRSAVIADQVAALRHKGYSYIELGVQSDGTHDGGPAFSHLPNYGFDYQPFPSLVVDLSNGLDATWASFEGRARNMIRKSEKKGVVAQVEPLGPALLTEYVSMLESTFRHRGLALPHPFGAYAAMVRHLLPINCLMFASARYERRLISAGIFLYHGDRMVFHSGSSTPEGLSLAGSSLVQWKVMQEGFKKGVHCYDLGGVGVDSIDQFKKSFGGVPVQHHRWIYSSPLVRQGARVAGWLARKGFLRVFG